MYAIVAPEFTQPTGYTSTEDFPKPVIRAADDVLIRIRAASVNPVDVKKAAGAFKAAITETFPYVVGYDAAGIVEATGEGVTEFGVGDEVFVRLPESARGSWSEYAVCASQFIAHKPRSIDMGDAAALPLAAMTALQALQQYRGSLQGKTVLVLAGLGGTGAFACQLAKNVFGAGRVITTVSTAKVPLVPELLGAGVVDQVIDYTKEAVGDVVPRASVDFLFDTTGQAMELLSLLVPSTGLVVSISTAPSGATLQNSGVMQRPDHPRLPLAGRLLLDAADAVRRLRAWRWGVEYKYIFLEPRGTDLAKIAGYVDAGQLRPVVGSRVDLHDLDAVRAAAQQVFHGKGGVGKVVFEFD